MKYALVTGASKGIGKALAYELCKSGFSLLITARDRQELDTVKRELINSYKVDVRVYAVDLSHPSGAEDLTQWVINEKVPVSVLVNNAGYGIWGKFHLTSKEAQLKMLQVNINSVLQITHNLLPHLSEREKAYILNVASTTAYQSVPAMSVYAASKSFIVSFTRALKYELRNSKVSVTCLSPGSTETFFMNRAGIDDPYLKSQANKVNMSPADVARIALEAMWRGESEVIPGFVNKMGYALSNVMPKSIVEKFTGKLYDRD